MGNYVPGTADEQRQMLAEIGLTSAEDLFAAIPGDVKRDDPLDLHVFHVALLISNSQSTC